MPKKKDSQKPDYTIELFDEMELAYAENRNQDPAHIFSTRSGDPISMCNFHWISGKPSYISIADGAQLAEILCLMAEAFRHWRGKAPFIAIAGKHGNPCGASVNWDYPIDAISNALWGDPTAVMGGEIVTNFPITDEMSKILFRVEDEDIKKVGRDKWGLDLILAPEFSDGAIDLLGKKEKRRLPANPYLLEAPFSRYQWVYRQVLGDFIRQKTSDFILTQEIIQSWSGQNLLRRPEKFQDMIIAWACCWRASSNSVALANNKMLIGLGCGQQDRIACTQLALDRANRAGHNTGGSMFASDGFFPYAEKETMFSDNDHRNIRDAMVGITASLAENRDDTLIRLSNFSNLVRRIDKREGPQLLVDAGCIGGVVPADGKELENVRNFFQKNNMAVAFVPPQFRGFSKH